MQQKAAKADENCLRRRQSLPAVPAALLIPGKYLHINLIWHSLLQLKLNEKRTLPFNAHFLSEIGQMAKKLDICVYREVFRKKEKIKNLVIPEKGN